MATGDGLDHEPPIEKSPTQDSITPDKPPSPSTTTTTRTIDGQAQQQPQHPTGWRLNLVLAATFIGLCLSLLDTTIVAVSLPTIAEHFDEYDRSTWIINAYIITYMAFSIVIARLSDIFSCRSVQAGSFVLFIAFSLGCALSTSMTQLIVFRALQGIGGSGLYSMTMVIVPSLTPPQKRSMIGAYIALCVTTSGVLGPILGGAITNHRDSHTWPWIFWINLPIAGSALAVFLAAWPSGKARHRLFSLAALLSIDFLGCLLLLAASTLLVFALLEAGTFQFAWDSPVIVTCLVLSAASLTAFVLWQSWVAAHPDFKIRVVFPVKTITQRVVAAGMISTFISGFIYYIAIVNLPARFQIVSGDAPITAGLRLLPLLLSSGAGAILGGFASARRNRTAPTLILASASQLLGAALMTTLGLTTAVPAKQYGFQVFLGLGFGMTMSAATQMMHLQAAPQWLVTQGSLAQLRSLGGSIGLALATLLFTTQTRSSPPLLAALSPAELSSLYKSPIVIETFSPQQQALVAGVFARAFTLQMRVAMGVAAVGVGVSLATWERRPPEMPGRHPPPEATTEASAEAGEMEAGGDQARNGKGPTGLS